MVLYQYMQDVFKKGKTNLHLHLLYFVFIVRITCTLPFHKMGNRLGHDNDKTQKLVDRS